MLVIVASILIGLLIVGNYGESWDEFEQTLIARYAVGAYRGIADHTSGNISNYHGPFYDMLVQGIVQFAGRLFPRWLPVEVRHFTNFLAFQMAVLALYSICLKLASRTAALTAALMFETQPLLFGHAFINPKDAPFMAFFLAATAVGLAMITAYEAQSLPPASDEIRRLRSSLATEWQSKPTSVRVFLIALLTIAMVGVLDVLLFDRLILEGVKLFLSSEADVSRWDGIYSRVQVPIALAILTVAALASAFVFVRTVNRVWANRFHRNLILGGLLLGWATSMRIAGPFAGVLVSGYFLARAKIKAIPPLVLYWVIAGVATYLTWPFLWSAPLKHFLETFQTMGDFPWEGEVLYRGMVFGSDNIPLTYVPHLLSIQFTETTLVVFAIGLAAGLWRMWTGALDRQAWIVVLIWFVLPLATQLLLAVLVFDNTRHFMYMMPAIFILSSVGLDAVLGYLKHRALKTAAIALLLLPGIAGIVRLHPYEYTYYNSLAGGPRGAFRSYEMDYWCTSYREAILYVNEVAAPDAEVAVWGPFFATWPYLRDDLTVYPLSDPIPPEWEADHQPDFVVLCTRTNADEMLYPEAEVVRQVTREGAIFSVVKKTN
jgi:hypothetical protein